MRMRNEGARTTIVRTMRVSVAIVNPDRRMLRNQLAGAVSRVGSATGTRLVRCRPEYLLPLMRYRLCSVSP